MHSPPPPPPPFSLCFCAFDITIAIAIVGIITTDVDEVDVVVVDVGCDLYIGAYCRVLSPCRKEKKSEKGRENGEAREREGGGKATHRLLAAENSSAYQQKAVFCS